MEKNDFLILSNNNKDEQKLNLQMKGFYYYAVAAFLYGVVSFHPKFIHHLSPTNQFDSNSFMLYRSISQILLAMYLSKRNCEPISYLNDIQHKEWFFVRTFVNYLNFLCFILSTLYLRAATASAIMSLCPVVAVIVAVLILKDKFFMRYAYGLLICTIGTFIMVLNEKGTEQNSQIHNESDASSFNIFLGIIFAIIALITEGLIIVSIRVLSVNKMNLETQSYYIGTSNALCAIIYGIITFNMNFDLYLIVMGFVNGILFYITNYYCVESLKLISVSKISGLAYLTVLVVFFLGFLILGEPLYLTDFIGSIMILGVNSYDAMYPVN